MKTKDILEVDTMPRVGFSDLAANEIEGDLDRPGNQSSRGLGVQQTHMALASLGSQAMPSSPSPLKAPEFSSWLRIEEIRCPHCRTAGYQIRYSVGRACRVVEGRCFRCKSSRRSIHELGAASTDPR